MEQIKNCDYFLPNLTETQKITGAGDNFAVGLAYGLIHQNILEECILYGQLCGAKSTVALCGFTASLYESELHNLILNV